MKAAWYDRTGPAGEVLVVGELPDPEPAAGQVRVRVRVAGINPADVKRRAGAGGRIMAAERVIPGDDAAGVIDRVGPRVPAARVGERVWVYSANHGNPFGTSAEYVVVPAERAVRLPPGVPFEVGAGLGVPALTAHRCLYADGPVDGLTVLVTGGAGAVGHYAVQMAKYGGATVLATASGPEKRAAARRAGADRVIDYRSPDAVGQIRAAAPGGVQRIVEVAFGANLPLTTSVIAENGVLASYASDAEPEPRLPFYPLMRRGVTIRTVLVFVMPPPARHAATEHVTRLLADGVLTHPVAARHPVAEVAEAHRRVERGAGIGKVLLTMDG